MRVVLHGDGQDKSMHLTNTDSFQHKIVFRKEVLIHRSKWETPDTTYQDLIYKFTYHDGTFYHYKLVEPDFV